MLRQFAVGGGVSVVNIAIHAFVMTMVVEVARRASMQAKSHPSLFLIAVMIPTVSVLMATHDRGSLDLVAGLSDRRRRA